MVGIWSFPIGVAYFQGLLLLVLGRINKFCKSSFPLQKLSAERKKQVSPWDGRQWGRLPWCWCYIMELWHKNPTELTLKPWHTTPRQKWTAANPKTGGGWKMIFLYNWVIFIRSMLIFQGETTQIGTTLFFLTAPLHQSPFAQKKSSLTLFSSRKSSAARSAFFVGFRGAQRKSTQETSVLYIVFTHWYQMCWNANWLTPNMIAIGVASEHI